MLKFSLSLGIAENSRDEDRREEDEGVEIRSETVVGCFSSCTDSPGPLTGSLADPDNFSGVTTVAWFFSLPCVASFSLDTLDSLVSDFLSSSMYACWME